MEKLQELRNAQLEKQKKIAITEKIHDQFDKIAALKEQKELLQWRVTALKEGQTTSSLYPEYVQQQQTIGPILDKIADVKRKLSSYRLLGPCGLSVLEVQANALSLSFTSSWKQLVQTYILRIADSNNQIKVSGTTIPYFIDVSSLISDNKETDWSLLMEEIAVMINAYTQRRAEVELFQLEYSTDIRQLSHNEAFTSLDIRLSLVCDDIGNDGGETIIEVGLGFIYGDLKSVYPQKVNVSSCHFIPKEDIAYMRSVLKSKSLTDAFPVVKDKLRAVTLQSE